MLSASPTPVPTSQASNWDPPPQKGDQGYVSPLVDLYPEQDSDLEALYADSPADREPVSYEDALDAVSGSEADPAESESIHSEDHSYRETVHMIKSYMRWSFIPDLECVEVCTPHIRTTLGQAAGLTIREKCR